MARLTRKVRARRSQIMEWLKQNFRGTASEIAEGIEEVEHAVRHALRTLHADGEVHIPLYDRVRNIGGVPHQHTAVFAAGPGDDADPRNMDPDKDWGCITSELQAFYMEWHQQRIAQQESADQSTDQEDQP
jgi:hypothetical protein